jgi:hypothetical protein
MVIIFALAFTALMPEPAFAVTKNEKKELPIFENDLAAVNAFTKQLIKDRGAKKPEEKLWVIADYISDPANGFIYSRTGGKRDAVKFFKPENRKGVCTAFAILYTLMGRAAGLEVKEMTSDKKNHAIVSFKLDGKWRYFDITAQTCWSENKELTLIKDALELYEGGDVYKAAFLNKSGIIYKLDRSDNRGYTNEVSMRVFTDDPKDIAFLGSDDYKENESWDIANIEYLKSYIKPRVKASGRSKSARLTVRKPAYFATRLISYEVSYRKQGKKVWSKVKSYNYSAKKTITIKGLKKNKKYDIRVRTVKNIGGVKYRSAFTKVRVKTK